MGHTHKKPFFWLRFLCVPVVVECTIINHRKKKSIIDKAPPRDISNKDDKIRLSPLRHRISGLRSTRSQPATTGVTTTTTTTTGSGGSTSGSSAKPRHLSMSHSNSSQAHESIVAAGRPWLEKPHKDRDIAIAATGRPQSLSTSAITGRPISLSSASALSRLVGQRGFWDNFVFGVGWHVWCIFPTKKFQIHNNHNHNQIDAFHSSQSPK